MRPDLNDVRVFATAGRAGTLSSAARELGVPPSTISRSITRLEKQLNVLLVHRSPRGLALTDSGQDYLQTCRRALRALKEGGDRLDHQRLQPRGMIRIACPVTMARDVLAPLQKEFLRRYPCLRVEIESYCSQWDQEPRDDVDVFFKLRAPKDSLRRVRPYPSACRGLFASSAYLQLHGSPSSPDDLLRHTCVGSGLWKLTRGKTVASPDIQFRVVTSDPHINLTLATQGVGICLLPLWMADWPGARKELRPVLPAWRYDPLTLCALFFGPSRLSPKVQALLDFLGEYIGTPRDPRLRQKWKKSYFSDFSIAPVTRP